MKEGVNEKAIATLKKAISLAPNYLKAHSEYIRVKTYILEKYDEVRTEYDSLMAREPDNPVYPMALAMGQSLTTGKKMMTWFEKVAELAPDWAWGHYAQAALWSEKEPEKAAAEFRFAQRPANTDKDRFEYCFPEDWQRQNYTKQRALALQAFGPTDIFIDRQGNVRYRQFGFDEETAHVHEIVINDLKPHFFLIF